MFALEGINWRAWTAADRAAVAYRLLKQTLTGDDLRGLYELVGDRSAIAALDREIMGQAPTIQTDR